jgi:hypothetical protein
MLITARLSVFDKWMWILISQVNCAGAFHKCAMLYTGKIITLNTVHPRSWLSVRKRDSLQEGHDNKLIQKISLIALLCCTCPDNNTFPNTCFHCYDIDWTWSYISGYFMTLCTYQCICGVRSRTALLQCRRCQHWTNFSSLSIHCFFHTSGTDPLNSVVSDSRTSLVLRITGFLDFVHRLVF